MHRYGWENTYKVKVVGPGSYGHHPQSTTNPLSIGTTALLQHFAILSISVQILVFFLGFGKAKISWEKYMRENKYF